MLVTLNEVMKTAEERKIAVGSFNTPNLEALQAVIGAAKTGASVEAELGSMGRRESGAGRRAQGELFHLYG